MTEDLPKNRAVTYIVIALLATAVLVGGYITSDVWAGVLGAIIQGAK